MWWPGKIPSGVALNEMMSHIDRWATLCEMAASKAPPTGEMMDNAGKPILLRQHRQQRVDPRQGARHSAQHLGSMSTASRSWACASTWATTPRTRTSRSPGSTSARPRIPPARPEQNLGPWGAVYNPTMDPFEKYDMLFQRRAMSTRQPTNSPGKWSGMDNGWVLCWPTSRCLDFNKSINGTRTSKRFPGGDRNDLVPNLKNPDNGARHVERPRDPGPGGRRLTAPPSPRSRRNAARRCLGAA